MEDPQQKGKNIGKGSHNIHEVMKLFAHAAKELVAAGRRSSGRATAEEQERVLWSAVQADGSHQSLEPSLAAEAGGGGGSRYLILRNVLDTDLALGRSDVMDVARWVPGNVERQSWGYLVEVHGRGC